MKRRHRSHPLHPSERFLLAIVTGHLCFLPWALGDMHVWSQVISCGLSVLGITVALSRRYYGVKLTHEANAYRLIMWPKLISYPLFWIGAVLLIYILIQALNPAWHYARSLSGWWLVRIPHVAWLPAGMKTPFAMASPWRSLMIYGSAWLTLCSIWVGFTRRKTLRIFFAFLASNAFALAILGIAERALHAEKIFWSWQPPAGYFVSSFIYKNHAGAYFDLILSVCLGLAAWYFTDPRSRLERSNPSGLFAFFSLTVALIVFYSFSRTATILMFALFLFVLLLYVRHLLQSGTSSRPTFIAVLLGAIICAAGAIAVYLLPTKDVLEHIDQLVATYQSPTPGFRTLATRATLDLWHDQPAYGWGAGSFRFAFPIHQQNYPEIYEGNGRRLHWDHAHNDYAELLAELGLVGVGIIASAAISYLIIAWRSAFWKNPLSLIVFAGCVMILIHGSVDFNFYNPAILTTWCALLPALVRWSELNKPS